MKFNINKNPYHKFDFDSEAIKIARSFSKKLHDEFGTFLKSVILFGSTTRKKEHVDIDILVIVDDVSIKLSKELAETFRIITEKIVVNTSEKLHVVSMRLTTFFEYIHAGDPIGLNILRDGIALIDTGFFEPMQILLMQGRIRPTKEAIYSYYLRAPRSIMNSKWHIMQACVDLYWSVIDSAHAAIMQQNIVPPTPEDVADLLTEHFVNKNYLDPKYPQIMKKFYTLQKLINHREIKEISGLEYDNYKKEATDFVNKMKEFIK